MTHPDDPAQGPRSCPTLDDYCARNDRNRGDDPLPTYAEITAQQERSARLDVELAALAAGIEARAFAGMVTSELPEGI